MCWFLAAERQLCALEATELGFVNCFCKKFVVFYASVYSQPARLPYSTQFNAVKTESKTAPFDTRAEEMTNVRPLKSPEQNREG